MWTCMVELKLDAAMLIVMLQIFSGKRKGNRNIPFNSTELIKHIGDNAHNIKDHSRTLNVRGGGVLEHALPRNLNFGFIELANAIPRF